MSSNSYDVVILGCGPAGASAALALKNSKLKICIVDKSSFPRDKICGDALSIDVVNQLPSLSKTLTEKFVKLCEKTPSKGVRIIAPSNKHIDIPLYYKGEAREGYICKRYDFDNLLYEEVLASGVEFIQDEFLSFKRVYNLSVIEFKKQTLSCKLVFVADGANSAFKTFLNINKIDRKHHSAGLRQYFSNLNNFNQGNFIELYFLKNILPGYIWIFPLPNNEANVGIGILSKTIESKRLNLKEILKNELSCNPLFVKRFANAIPKETPKGYGLPLGNTKRNISGDGYLLLGDAAGLIDPFSGEGIGNAIRSGRIAAEFVIKNPSNNYNKEACLAYDNEIFKRMGAEFEMSRVLQNLSKKPALFNWVVKKANSSSYINQQVIKALADNNAKQIFKKPKFYLELLFK